MKLENVKLNVGELELVLNVGCPMNKTNAPRAYNKLFQVLGMNAIMLPVEVPKGGMREFMQACKTLNVHYICPTMPHKGDIIPFLDDVDDTSRLFHSVNAVRIDKDGVSHGTGMDGRGAVSAMVDAGVELKGVNALMYGAGSISGVVGYELAVKGVKKLYIANRTPDKAEEVAKLLREHTAMEAVAIGTDAKSLDGAAAECGLVANVTPLGMCGFPAKHDYLGFIDKLPKSAAVFDCIINPPDTEVILAGKANGLRTVPGMQMLAGQMGVIFDFMFGVKLGPEHKEACIEELCEFLHVKR